MTPICMRAEKLAKKFLIHQSPNTAMRTLRGLFGGGVPKKELWVLKDLTFQIEKGQKVALIGKNGSGKTTLLRILAGIHSRTSGTLEVHSEPKVLFNVLAGLNGDLSVLDNIFLFGAIHRIPQSVLKKRAEDILSLTELESLKFCSLKELSRGQQQRLALGVFFETTSDFLIFDECLSFIDQGFFRRAEEKLQRLFSKEKTVITASHDAAFLKKHCEMALWIDGGELRMFDRVDTVLKAYENQMYS